MKEDEKEIEAQRRNIQIIVDENRSKPQILSKGSRLSILPTFSCSTKKGFQVGITIHFNHFLFACCQKLSKQKREESFQ